MVMPSKAKIRLIFTSFMLAAFFVFVPRICRAMFIFHTLLGPKCNTMMTEINREASSKEIVDSFT